MQEEVIPGGQEDLPVDRRLSLLQDPKLCQESRPLIPLISYLFTGP